MTKIFHITKDGWTFSTINHGYGSEKGLFEVGIFPPNNGLSTVQGYLTMEEVNNFKQMFVKDPQLAFDYCENRDGFPSYTEDLI